MDTQEESFLLCLHFKACQSFSIIKISASCGALQLQNCKGG
uniref:Uncharacterized protein n=1 Tax=Arundo donax TaxID=35708 RepID=A0A0A8YZR9_ARUDO